MCGENDYDAYREPGHEGSSPRVRGKPVLLLDAGLYARLIPACAGKTGRSSSNTGNRRAHPRVCGENQHVSTDMSRAAGSSPRVRGKRRAGVPDGARVGLIPACAGKTRWASMRAAAMRAHPRVCGENFTVAFFRALLMGSSPRVRGNPVDCLTVG